MPIYLYSAAEKNGKIVKGEKDAPDEKKLAQLLKAEELFLLDAREKTDTAVISAKLNLDKILLKLGRVSLVDKMFFSRNLAVMIAAGFSLTRALEAIIEETASSKFKKILTDVNNAVMQGKSFAEALRLHEEVFGNLFINMIEAGETSGKLVLVLKLLANQMKKDNAIRKRVRGALIYPAIIISVLIIIGILMMIYVVPVLTQTLKEIGAELPLSTRIIIGASDFMLHYSYFAAGGLALLVLGVWRLLKIKKWKGFFDRLVLRLPIFGPLIKKYNEARFCRTLAYLITSGVPIVRSLEITSSVLGNSLFKDAVSEAAKEIQKGEQLNRILDAHRRVFQTLVIQMIAVGEETGKISDMLLRLALFFEEDVTNATKNLSAVIEPLLMVVIGAAVGFFAISMIQPIYSSLGNIGG